MQYVNWNDLRYLIAIARGRTLSGAARLMNVDDTTVSRRLGVLRRLLGDELCIRQPDGKFTLTDVGVTVAGHAEVMEREADLIGDVVGSDHSSYAGTVRITSVPFLINRWLVPHLRDLLGSAPMLQIELIPESRDVNLDLREADIAIRFARPIAGGQKLLGRRIGSFAFAPYAARCVAAAQAKQLPWVGYEETMAHLPQAKWIANQVKKEGNKKSALQVHDLETAAQAVVSGVGRSLLPVLIADKEAFLRRLGEEVGEVSREVWLLTHRDRHALTRIRVVTDWIASLMASTRSK